MKLKIKMRKGRSTINTEVKVETTTVIGIQDVD